MATYQALANPIFNILLVGKLVKSFSKLGNGLGNSKETTESRIMNAPQYSENTGSWHHNMYMLSLIILGFPYSIQSSLVSIPVNHIRPIRIFNSVDWSETSTYPLSMKVHSKHPAKGLTVEEHFFIIFYLCELKIFFIFFPPIFFLLIFTSNNLRNWDVNEFGSLMSKIAITNSESRNFEERQNFVIFTNFEENRIWSFYAN